MCLTIDQQLFTAAFEDLPSLYPRNLTHPALVYIPPWPCPPGVQGSLLLPTDMEYLAAGLAGAIRAARAGLGLGDDGGHWGQPAAQPQKGAAAGGPRDGGRQAVVGEETDYGLPTLEELGLG